MDLTDKETLFLDRRRMLFRIWPYVGMLLLVGIAMFAAWLFWKTPLMINPYTVLEQLHAGTMPDSTMALLAGFLSLVLLACLMLLVTMVLVLFAALSNERKYMAIIGKLQAAPG